MAELVIEAMGPFLPSVTIYRDLGTTESGGQILGSRHLSHSLPQIWMDSRRGGVLIQRRGASGPLSLTLISSIIYPDFFFFFGRIHSMGKFPGQGWKPCHSRDPSLRGDNAGSLPARSPGNSYPEFSLPHTSCFIPREDVL